MADFNPGLDPATQAALSYKNRGWMPIAVRLPGEPFKARNGDIFEDRVAKGKEPRAGRGWQNATNPDDTIKQMRSRASNVGVLLGSPSGGLTDIDLDCPEAIAMAADFLLPTKTIFGRKTAPQSHWLYEVEDAVTKKYLDPIPSLNKEGKKEKTVILEIRSTGAQTVFPGSLHESGEKIKWVGSPGDPAILETVEPLKRACKRLTAAVLLARHWKPGTYHDATLPLVGGLIRATWTDDEIRHFLTSIGTTTSMTNLEDRLRTIQDSRARLDRGEHLTGWPTLKRFFPEEVVTYICALLEISNTAVLELGSVDLSTPVPPLIFPHVKETSKKGFSPLGTYENFAKLIEAYGLEFGYDVYSKDWIGVGHGYKAMATVGLRNEHLPTRLYSQSTLCQLPMNPQLIRNYAYMAAQEHPVNPVLDWLESLKWDGRTRLERLYDTVELNHITKPQTQTKREVLYRWFLQSCAAADHKHQSPLFKHNQLVNFERILLFQGIQGVKKTRWFMSLPPEHLEQYVGCGVFIDPDNKDSVAQATRYWLAEIGEIDSTFRKSDLARLKAFLSMSEDTYRPPYAPAAVTYPRRTSFGGTVNEMQFLADATGNRRYMVLAVDKMHPLDTKFSPGGKAQVWAELWSHYINGAQWWPTDAEEKNISVLRQAFELIEVSEEAVGITEVFGDDLSFEAKQEGSVQMSARDIGVVTNLIGPNTSRSQAVQVSRTINLYLQRHCLDKQGRPDMKMRQRTPCWTLPKPKELKT